MNWIELYEKNYNGFVARSPKECHRAGFKEGSHAAALEFEKIINESTLSLPTKHYILRKLKDGEQL